MVVEMQDSDRLKVERWKNMLDFPKLHCYRTSYKFQRSVNLCPYHYQNILLYYSLLIKKNPKPNKLPKSVFIPADFFQ